MSLIGFGQKKSQRILITKVNFRFTQEKLEKLVKVNVPETLKGFTILGRIDS